VAGDDPRDHEEEKFAEGDNGFPQIRAAIEAATALVSGQQRIADLLQELLGRRQYALRTPGFADELRRADADYVAGNTVSGREIRERYGLT
jgi:hypothetical protein